MSLRSLFLLKQEPVEQSDWVTEVPAILVPIERRVLFQRHLDLFLLLSLSIKLLRPAHHFYSHRAWQLIACNNVYHAGHLSGSICSLIYSYKVLFREQQWACLLEMKRYFWKKCQHTLTVWNFVFSHWQWKKPDVANIYYPKWPLDLFWISKVLLVMIKQWCPYTLGNAFHNCTRH